MAQVAGHVTNYRNLRRITEEDTSIDPSWCEVRYYQPGGTIERFADRLGRGHLLRPIADVRRYLSDAPAQGFDALFVNTSAADWYRAPFARTPSIFDFDATPIQLHGMVEYGRRHGSPPVASLRRRAKARLWGQATYLHAWSEWAKGSAVNDYGIDPEKVVVNPPGVDLQRWRPANSAARQDSVLKVLFVGGDFERKGGPLLLDWFTRARTRDVELHLVTRDQVPDTEGVVVHRDFEPNSERLLNLFRACDVFVLPSSAECFGIATVEAMASGLPVVVTDVGASRELVEGGCNGHIVMAGDKDELGDAVTDILNDEGRRQSMARRSRQIAEARFSLRTNAHATLALLKRAADASAG